MISNKPIDIFICGAAKSGTQMLVASLYDTGYIDKPEIYGEPNFFTLNYGKGVDWYHGLYVNSDRMLRVDASPTYMNLSKDFISRMNDYNPKSKLIFVLRNPVSRAWAHYWANVRKGNERQLPIQAFKFEPDHIAHSERNLLKYGYIARSRYFEALQPFVRQIDPSRRHVIVLENYRDNPEIESVRLSKFLDLPSEISIPINRAKGGTNVGGLPRFLGFHHFISRNKRIFRKTAPTRRLWKFLNHTNLTRWGRPYPKIDKICEHYLTDALSDDRAKLVSLLEWPEDPWTKNKKTKLNSQGQDGAHV